jgi:hypothetical protein
MNTFARAFAAALGSLLLTSGAFAQPGLKLPPAGDCHRIAAERGARGFWLGRFSGIYVDAFDHRWPLFGEGCFETEYACRRWVNEMQTLADAPGIMSCKPASSR